MTRVMVAAAAVAGHTSRVDLLINGAGVHEATDLTSKPLSSFRRVRDVKLLGYHNLRAAFAPLRPRQWCDFGSISGVFGLSGEIDHASVNDMLAAAARYRDPDAECAEHTLAWTIWKETGMSSRGLVRDFVVRGGAHWLVSTASGRGVPQHA